MTSNEIFEAREDGEPVLWTSAQVHRVLAQHSIGGPDRVDFCEKVKPVRSGHLATDKIYDAAQVLEWLGY